MRRARTVTLGLTLCILLFAATWIGGARASGGISSPAAAERQLIQLIRADWQTARAKRCKDDVKWWRDVREIPDDRLFAVRRWHQRHLRDLRQSSNPRALCRWSHQWAESQAGRCVSSKEGGLRSVSLPSGTWHGKWQMNAAFELAYGRAFVRQWGRASSWPEWTQDLVAYRGYRARGWWPWENTARACGLL